VGWFVVAAGVVGLLLLLLRPGSRLVTIGWLASAAPLLVVLYQHQYQPFRDALPVVPFLAIAAATLVGDLGAWARRHLQVGQTLRWGVTGALVVVVVVVTMIQGTIPAVQASTGIVDSRTQAIDWLATHTHEGQRVLVAQELAILPSELARIPATVEVAPSAGPNATSPGPDVDVVVTGAFRGPQVVQWRRLGRQTVTFGDREVVTDPKAWRYNDERVIIQLRQP
jgi:hypothetical protein